MNADIEQAFVRQFEADVHALYKRMGEKLKAEMLAKRAVREAQQEKMRSMRSERAELRRLRRTRWRRRA
jgi:hypothetical protein